MWGITAGPDGNLWFTEDTAHTFRQRGGQVGRITPNGKITEFSAGLDGYPNEIAAGPDGSVWFIVDQASRGIQIGKITPNGKITSFHLCGGCAYLGLTTGPDHNLWLSDDGVATWAPHGSP